MDRGIAAVGAIRGLEVYAAKAVVVTPRLKVALANVMAAGERSVGGIAPPSRSRYASLMA